MLRYSESVAADVSVDGNEGADDADIDKGDNAGYAQDDVTMVLSGENTILVQVGRHGFT